jgi:hypothetical protein
MKQYNNQKGNVLFLILIAVALFAALSYAVTQSSRSGGDASRETNILNAAQLTQYPTSIRTAVLRLVIDGYQDTNILFNPPADITTSEDYEVFATVGGGAIHQNAPGEVMQTGGVNEDGTWYLNMDFEVPELGREADANTAGNELIAFLPGITESVCTRINVEAGVIGSSTTANPTFGSDVVNGDVNGSVQKNINLLTDYNYNNEVDFPVAFTGQPLGCFHNNTGGSEPFVMYVVVLER